jgi:DNA-binding LytR/AlgR family response regulator
VPNLTCIIVDDEPIARELLVTYCSYLPNLKVVAVCANALQAREALFNEKADILLIDIEMPVLDGVSFLKTLNYLPQVIFTTAFTDYAVTAFELAACDYLVKPFSLERFIKAIDKATARLTINDNQKNITQTHILIKADNKLYQLRVDDILFTEASGNYTKIYLGNKIIKPNISFTTIEGILPNDLFLRIHRSFIINKQKVNHVEGNRIFIETFEIPIGSLYKNKLAAVFGTM